jgi:uncharacterized surface protein with fasciclin (FAS1) repeats
MSSFAVKCLLCAGLAFGLSSGAKAQDASAVATPDQVGAAATVGSAVNAERIKTFANAVVVAGLSDELSGQMPVTIYAPSDAAFQAMEPGTLDTLMKPENKDLLRDFLHAHMVWGIYDNATMRRMDEAAGSADVPTVAGTLLHFRVAKGNTLTVTDSQGVEAKISPDEIKETNGVIEVIDHVLTPPAQDQ